MTRTALFVRHRAKPGQRDAVRAVWERFVKPRAAENPAHEAYAYCYDEDDPDVVCAFQILSSPEALDEFLAGDWYPEYLAAVGEHTEEPPTITKTSAVWIK